MMVPMITPDKIRVYFYNNKYLGVVYAPLEWLG